MKKQLARLALTVAAILALCGVVVAMPDDIEWIQSLPGVSVLTSSSNGTVLNTVLSVTGDPEETWTALKAGLASHAWRIRSSANLAAGVTASRTLTATHAGHSLEIAFSTLPGMGVELSVSYRQDGGTVHLGPDQPASDSDNSGAPIGKTYSINGNGQTYNLHCDGSTINVAGNANHIDCHGVCSSIQINGNGNNVVFHGPVQTINLLGNGNHIKWSGNANSSPPTLNQVGNNNLLQRF